ncbi:hypothetical protein BDZ89DRAFT_1055468, partial [Hymenopellis radicata]
MEIPVTGVLSCCHTCPHVKLKRKNERDGVYVWLGTGNSQMGKHNLKQQHANVHPHCRRECPGFGKTGTRSATVDEMKRALPAFMGRLSKDTRNEPAAQVWQRWQQDPSWSAWFNAQPHPSTWERPEPSMFCDGNIGQATDASWWTPESKLRRTYPTIQTPQTPNVATSGLTTQSSTVQAPQQTPPSPPYSDAHSPQRHDPNSGSYSSVAPYNPQHNAALPLPPPQHTASPPDHSDDFLPFHTLRPPPHALPIISDSASVSASDVEMLPSPQTPEMSFVPNAVSSASTPRDDASVSSLSQQEDIYGDERQIASAIPDDNVNLRITNVEGRLPADQFFPNDGKRQPLKRIVWTLNREEGAGRDLWKRKTCDIVSGSIYFFSVLLDRTSQGAQAWETMCEDTPLLNEWWWMDPQPDKDKPELHRCVMHEWIWVARLLFLHGAKIHWCTLDEMYDAITYRDQNAKSKKLWETMKSADMLYGANTGYFPKIGLKEYLQGIDILTSHGTIVWPNVNSEVLVVRKLVTNYLFAETIKQYNGYVEDHIVVSSETHGLHLLASGDYVIKQNWGSEGQTVFIPRSIDTHAEAGQKNDPNTRFIKTWRETEERFVGVLEKFKPHFFAVPSNKDLVVLGEIRV